MSTVDGSTGPETRTDVARDALALLPMYLREIDTRADGTPGVLQSLVRLVGEQLGLVIDDIDQAYDDLFIETCAPWVVPYIGDLVGVLPGSPLDPGTVLTRAEVADAIALRRRKGTAAVIEQLAHDLADRPASAVEMFQRLAVSQNLQHVVPDRGLTVDVRSALTTERLDGPFDRTAHSAELRRVGSVRGRYAVPDIAVTVWRRLPLRHTRVDSVGLDARRFLVDPLGVDHPLATMPATESTITHEAGPLNVPTLLTRRAMAARAGDESALSDYYGEGRSLAVWLAGRPEPVDVADVVVCDLGDRAGGGWSNVSRLAAGQLGVDPELGRLATGSDQAAPPLVSWVSSAPSDTGANERLPDRLASFGAVVPVRADGAGGVATTIGGALAAGGGEGTVEVGDSRTYRGDLAVSVPPGSQLQVRGGSEHAPVVALETGWTIDVGLGSTVVLSYLTVSGGPVVVSGSPGRVVLDHCTLVPGGDQLPDEVALPVKPSLVLVLDDDWQTELVLDSCLVGPLQLPADRSSVLVEDCVLDALGAVALAADATGAPGPTLTMRRSTVLGSVSVTEVDLVEDSIVVGPLTSVRRGTGCLQYSWLADGSLTPRRHECQPAGPATPRPSFLSTHFGSPGYAELRRAGAAALVRGASDGHEMGAYARLARTQRDDNVRRRISEFLRFGMEAGVFDGD